MNRVNSPVAFRRTRVLLRVAGGLWVFAVGAGLVKMWDYENTAGRRRPPPCTWPAESAIRGEAGRATLVLFAHPRCPCTRASLGELALLMARCQERVTAHVLFLRRAGGAADWVKTDLWRNAAAIPGVEVSWDEDGVEARRFEAVTSGHALLYDAAGRLRFNGGITGSRGHSGDNAGRSTIVAWLNNGEIGPTETSVFGCSLLDPEPPPQRAGSLCKP